MANRLQSARDFNPYGAGVTMDELRKVRRQLAKVINQRMVRLENTKSAITGETYDFGAYNLMQDYLKDKGRNRFDERLKVADPSKDYSKRELQKEIRILQNFEQMPSSRVAGQKAIERRRIESFVQGNEDTGREGLSRATVTNKDFYDFLNSKTYEELANSFSSDDLVEEYDKASERGLSKDEIIDALEEYAEQHKRMSLKGIKQALRAKKVKTKRKRKA